MRLDIVLAYIFLAVICIGLWIEGYIATRKRKKKVQELIRTRNCYVCKNLGTMDCPNSSLCWSTSDRPYFIPKEEEKKK